MITVVKQKLQHAARAINIRRREYLAARPHKSFRKTKLPKTRPPLVGVWPNTVASAKTIWQERRIFAVLAVVYMVATYLFVGGIAQADFVELKQATLEVFGGSVGSLSTVASLLTSTMTGVFGGEITELQQFLSLLAAMLFWLAIIWTLRMRFAKQTIAARGALYSSAAPLVSYGVVGFFIMLQLSPGALGLFIFNVAQGGGYLQGGVEVMTFAVLALLLGALSVYWLAGSLVALVVVTLPQMYPWRAMRIASELAIYRRVRLLAHTCALALTLLLLWIVTLLPILLIDSWLKFDWLPLVPVVVQLLGALTIIYMATYVYRLYRSML